MADYNSALTGKQIDERLAKVPDLEQSVGDLSAEKVTRPATAQVGQVIAVKAVDADGKPTEWEAVDMASGGGVQSDWNQNDANEPDFIKNRQFYETEHVFIDDTAVLDGGMAFVPVSGKPSIGGSVTVKWGGDIYECVVVDLSGLSTIGNLAILEEGDDTGEPFVSIFQDETMMGVFALNPEITEIEIKISGTFVTKLPDKYYSKQTTIFSDNTYVYKGADMTTKLTSADVIGLLNTSAVIIMFPGEALCTILSASIDGVVMRILVNRNGDIRTLYSAEYTPETTT